MNRKHLKILSELDFTTLADIALKEKNNLNKDKLNVYYDLWTYEAIVYPEDDKSDVELRPLKNRLLKNGCRLNSELSEMLANSIQYAIKTNKYDILNTVNDEGKEK